MIRKQKPIQLQGHSSSRFRYHTKFQGKRSTSRSTTVSDSIQVH